MEFEIEKCAMLTIKSGERKTAERNELQNQENGSKDVLRNDEGRGLASIYDCVDASILELHLKAQRDIYYSS